MNGPNSSATTRYESVKQIKSLVFFYPAGRRRNLDPAEIVGQGPKGGRSLPHLTNVNAGQTNVNVCCFRATATEVMQLKMECVRRHPSRDSRSRMISRSRLNSSLNVFCLGNQEIVRRRIKNLYTAS
jgi:hypothetical protein